MGRSAEWAQEQQESELQAEYDDFECLHYWQTVGQQEQFEAGSRATVATDCKAESLLKPF